MVLNISKETTSKELIKIEGVAEYTQRMATINFSAGRTNAVEIGCNLFGMPTMDMWLSAFTNQEQTSALAGLHERQMDMLLVPHPESNLEKEDEESEESA